MCTGMAASSRLRYGRCSSTRRQSWWLEHSDGRDPAKREQMADRVEGEHVLTAQSPPRRGQILEGPAAGAMAGHVGGVDGTGRGPDQQVGAHVAFGQHLEHPDLHAPRLPPPESTKAVVTVTLPL